MTTRVQEDYEEGARIGINGTPGSIILNNRTGKAIPRSGAIPLAALEAVVQELLN
jgi:protein-disulfide isomerase